MLTHLDIRDFAIVDHASLELGAGMTVLTGETGAGKSILVDALGLVLGDRTSGGVVRAGTERAEVAATFETAGLPAVADRLAALDLADPDGACILRRTVGADGRSRAFVNGRPVPLQTLRDVGELLVDIHGQHAHQSLLRREAQRELLDAFAGHGELLREVRATCERWRTTRQAIDALGGSATERAAERDLLRYQVDELRALGLGPGELEEVSAEHRRLSHADTLLAAARQAAEVLEDAEDETVVSRLAALARELSELARLDERLLPVRELVEAAAIQAREAATEVRRYADGIDLDPLRLQWLEQRIAAVEGLARKHRVTAAGLAPHLARLDERLRELDQGEERLAALEAELDELRRRYDELASQLTASRAAAAAELAEAVVSNVQRLGMGGAQLAVEVRTLDTEEPALAGRDRIEIRVSANAGQPLAPLAQVASGGELSRISLAIQLIRASDRGVPTQIFDEVDAGIGGRVAEAVGTALRELSACSQVLCVTHLPQVAAQGQQHLQVAKQTRDGLTLATVTTLPAETRAQEVARMLAGAEVTARALEHAREMLERAAALTPRRRERVGPGDRGSRAAGNPRTG